MDKGGVILFGTRATERSVKTQQIGNRIRNRAGFARNRLPRRRSRISIIVSKLLTNASDVHLPAHRAVAKRSTIQPYARVGLPCCSRSAGWYEQPRHRGH